MIERTNENIAQSITVFRQVIQNHAPSLHDEVVEFVHGWAANDQDDHIRFGWHMIFTDYPGFDVRYLGESDDSAIVTLMEWDRDEEEEENADLD